MLHLSPPKIVAASDYGGMTGRADRPRKLQAIDREAFRDRLQYIREKSGLSKKDFGESIGLSKSNYGQAEAGKRMLTVDQIFAIFVVYGVPIEYLLIGREVDLPERFRH